MIDLLFHFAGDHIFVRIEGTNVTFGNTAQGAFMAPLKGLRLNREGVMKEFPDLKDNLDWQRIAIERFNDKIKKLPNEKSRSDYIIEDLTLLHHYKLKYRKIAGMRTEVFH